MSVRTARCRDGACGPTSATRSPTASLWTDRALWVAAIGSSVALRVAEGGRVLASVAPSQPVSACTLGGRDRRTLLLCAAPGFDPINLASPQGRIQVIDVEVP